MVEARSRSETGPGRVIVVGNLKGGSGKSTLAINLAGALVARGLKVAILDCDPQGTAMSWAGRGSSGVEVRFEPLRNLNGAGGWLVTAGELRRRFDILLIDLPAVVAPALGAAFLLADLILIPVAPQMVDIEGTRRVLAHLNTARVERRHSPPRALLVPTRVRDLERGLSPWQAMLEPLGLEQTPPMRLRPQFDQAFEKGGWVGERFPASEARREVDAIADRVLKELDGAAPAKASPPAQPTPAPAAAPVKSADGLTVHFMPDEQGPRRPHRSWWRRLVG